MKSIFVDTSMYLVIFLTTFEISEAQLIDNDLKNKTSEVQQLDTDLKTKAESLAKKLEVLQNNIDDLLKLVKVIETAFPESSSMMTEFVNNNTKIIQLKVFQTLFYRNHSFESFKKCFFHRKVSN